MKLLKKVFLLNISAVIITFVFTLGCQQQTTDTKPVSAVFDIQKAKSFIDSINTKFSEQIMNGDSVALASHYAPDAELLFSNSEPIKGKDIVTAWGGMIRSGTRNMTFTTTDLAGCDDFLIETGYYEIKENDNKVNRGEICGGMETAKRRMEIIPGYRELKYVFRKIKVWVYYNVVSIYETLKINQGWSCHYETIN